MSALVSVEDLTLRFGGVTALDGVSFGIDAGRLAAIIGPNGAGKTSLFNCMSGIYRATSGSIGIAGVEVTPLRPHRIARLGVARTFQTPALFGGLTVLENVLTGRHLHGRSRMASQLVRLPGAVREEADQRQRAEEILELLEISHHRHREVSDLPYGLRKRIEFGRALAQEPTLLLLDEPMAGMTLEEKDDMCAYILEARAALDITCVLVEHDMGVVMELAEQIVVLDFGRQIADGPPADVRRDPKVIAAYLGAETAEEPVA